MILQDSVGSVLLYCYQEVFNLHNPTTMIQRHNIMCHCGTKKLKPDVVWHNYFNYNQ